MEVLVGVIALGIVWRYCRATAPTNAASRAAPANEGPTLVETETKIIVGSTSRIRTFLPDFLHFKLNRKNRANGGSPIKVYVLACGVEENRYVIQGTRYADKHIKRCIMVSQVQGDEEVFIFGMYVYEFPANCGSDRNAGKVYIAYLDTTEHYIRNIGRHSLNFDIVNAYLEYVSALGYTYAYIWACPPQKNRNFYIFYDAQGKTQRNSNSLSNWYKKLLRAGEWQFSHRNHLDKQADGWRWPLFPNDIKKLVKEREILSQACETFKVCLDSGEYYDKYYEKVTKHAKFGLGRNDITRVIYSFKTKKDSVKSTMSILARWKRDNPPVDCMSNPSVKLYKA